MLTFLFRFLACSEPTGHVEVHAREHASGSLLLLGSMPGEPSLLVGLLHVSLDAFRELVLDLLGKLQDNLVVGLPSPVGRDEG